MEIEAQCISESRMSHFQWDVAGGGAGRGGQGDRSPGELGAGGGRGTGGKRQF